ncbi:MAG: hypothetical protein ABSC06_35050 [Rhodopila sp.]|jgi:hypothetical protein
MPSAALAWLPEPPAAPDAPLTPEAFLRANAVPLGVDLGTCVLVSLSGGWARAGMIEEGVVIEVVPPGCGMRSARVLLRHTASSRSRVSRYVVQCWTCRVLRRAQELLVVSP